MNDDDDFHLGVEGYPSHRAEGRLSDHPATHSEASTLRVFSLVLKSSSGFFSLAHLSSRLLLYHTDRTS
jgi:hypothetical protein